MSNNVHVIGNGKSRLTLNTKKLQGITIGCNAIHRDFITDILCCADERMVVEAQQNKFPNVIYTRKDWSDRLGVKSFPKLPYNGNNKFDDPWHWNTGPHAINLACAISSPGSVIHLHGFDCLQNDVYENIYQGSKNYNSNSVNPAHWYYQISKLIESYTKLNFVWYAPKEFICPQEWYDQTNFDRQNTK